MLASSEVSECACVCVSDGCFTEVRSALPGGCGSLRVTSDVDRRITKHDGKFSHHPSIKALYN